MREQSGILSSELESEPALPPSSSLVGTYPRETQNMYSGMCTITITVALFIVSQI